MKLAAIDIGSNSIHMIVAHIDATGSLEIIDRIKEMVGLGEETMTTGYLSEAAQERGLVTLREFRRIADAHQVDDVITVATAAVRAARNGENFIRRINDECALNAKVIDGREEGRLIYLGAREVVDFGTKKTLIADLGGGSLELVLATQRREQLGHSLKLGVRVLKGRFLLGNPPTSQEIEELVAHIRGRFEGIVRPIRSRGVDTILGTSGTFGAIRKIAIARGDIAEDSNVVPREVVEKLTEDIGKMTADERLDVPGLLEKRHAFILHGLVVMRTILEPFGADSYTYCDAALREGLLADYLDRNRPDLVMREEIPDPRRRSVIALCKRFYDAPAHPKNVARLAVRLFDDRAVMHRMSSAERELLEFAGRMHNVGKLINSGSHHKHSEYIIRNADLVGFTDREQQIMATVARYHRRSAPKSRHPGYMELAPEDRDLVKKLSVLLRLATALDRGHRGNVHRLSCTIKRDRLILQIMTYDDPSLELIGVRAQEKYVRDVFGLRLDADVLTVIPTGF